MKYEKMLTILVFCIVILSIVAAACGIFMNDGPGRHEYRSLHGEIVTIYGKGLYKNESANLGPQARAQGVVTMFVCVPLLLISLYSSRKGSLKGRLLLTGILGYFLYTFTQYTSIS